ncbi:MAG: zinc ribbon domain-containing protein [Halobellus sp.]
MGSRSRRGKRPWLAALLGTLATGLGHFYLRRWRRGLGWFLAAVITSLAFVPADAARALLNGGGDPAALFPMFLVGVASVADAYVLARASQREARAQADESAAEEPSDDSRPEPSTATSSRIPGIGGTADGEPMDGAACPNCGKELDPDLDFCPWCTTRLD